MLCCAVPALANDPAPSLPAPATRAVDFVKDIQPTLVDRCYACHGPEKQKADLRWDVKASAFKTGEHGPIIVPGKSAASRLIKLVAGLDPDTVMPPRGERLSSAQIGLLRAWIDQGANWPDNLPVANATDHGRDHWAFKAPNRPPVPSVKRKAWVRDPIDNFILARLEKENLKPSPEADRATLIRRLSLDLVGLPPTLQEVNDFLADRGPDAYERLVERLLASPHYGERWGRHWLDVARYADTNGYEKDNPRSIWPYRDWVIKAFNRDLPFDQFTIEQLAGDLLPNCTLDQRVATGFLRNAMLNQEGGIEPEQFRHEAIVDRIDAVGKAFLGLTLNCCQCHNHKFDPFSQQEYYQLFALLNNDDESFTEVPTAAETRKREEILSKIRDLEDKAISQTTNLAERMATWEKKMTGQRASNGADAGSATNALQLGEARTEWTVLNPSDWFNFASKFEKQDDLSLLGGGDLQRGSTMHVWAETTLTNITGFRLEALTNANLMYGGPGLTGSGSFLLKQLVVEAAPLVNPTVTNRVKFRRAIADSEAQGFSVINAIDGNTDKGGWCPCTTPDHRNQNHYAVFECEEPVGFPGGTRLLFTLHEQFHGDTKLDCHMLGSLRLDATTNSTPLTIERLSSAERQAAAVPFAQRSPEQKRLLFDRFRKSDPEFGELNKKIADAWAEWPNSATTLVLHQRDHPRVTHLFTRGDRLRPAQEVQTGVPAALNPFPAGAPRNRLGLAEWIVDPQSPTTARAMVNRIWMEYFGEGLVTTPADFGTRAEKPLHPELLDWLACEFMQPKAGQASRVRSAGNDTRSGAGETPGQPGRAGETPAPPWSIKHIHRLIVNSATYRQASVVRPTDYAHDPYDRLLERAPRLRVEGEVVQDIALSVSGLLNPKVGGPSVFPPIPTSIGDTAYGGFSWTETKGEDRYRRGLYTFWKRSLTFPSLAAFDVPSGETSCPRRVRSNTPLQALTTLNEQTFVEAAQALALRILKEGGADNRARAGYVFRLCTAREPTPAELAQLLKFWDEQFDYFEHDSASAIKVAIPEPAKLPPKVNVHQAAAWAMVSRAVLNLDETITKE